MREAGERCVEQGWAEPPKVGKMLDSRQSFCCSLSFPLPFHECPCWFLDTQKLFQSWKLLSLWEHLASVARSFQADVPCDTQDAHTAAKCLTPTHFYRQRKNNSKARGTLWVSQCPAIKSILLQPLFLSKEFYRTIYQSHGELRLGVGEYFAFHLTGSLSTVNPVLECATSCAFPLLCLFYSTPTCSPEFVSTVHSGHGESHTCRVVPWVGNTQTRWKRVRWWGKILVAKFTFLLSGNSMFPSCTYLINSVGNSIRGVLSEISAENCK